jgi:two-component system phosphate regulon response regulator PhoB
VRVDQVRHQAYVEDEEIHLTPTEFRLLLTLISQPGRTFTRSQLIDAVTGGDTIVLERTIDVHIKALRKKVGDAGLIETVRGLGYRFREK